MKTLPFSKISSVSIDTDKKHSVHNFNVYLNRTTKREKMRDLKGNFVKDSAGNDRWITKRHFPKMDVSLTRANDLDELGSVMRNEAVKVYGSATKATYNQCAKRIKLIQELETNSVDYYLTGTKENFHVEIVVMDNGKSIKGVLYAIDRESTAKKVQLKKLFFVISEKNNVSSETNEVKTPYSVKYQGKRCDTVKKAIISDMRVIEDNTVFAVEEVSTEEQVKHILRVSTNSAKTIMYDILNVRLDSAAAREITILRKENSRLRKLVN